MRIDFSRHRRSRTQDAEPVAPQLTPIHAVRLFFAEYLTPREGSALLPGLTALSTSFALDVAPYRGEDPAASFVIVVAEGVLSVAREIAPDGTGASAPGCRARVAAADLLRVAAGDATPQSLFVTGRLRVAGNPLPILKAAPAMEELFRLHPYTRSAE